MSRVISRIAILTLYHPRLVPGGAQQCAYDLHLQLKRVQGLDSIFIAATSPKSPIKEKANAFIRRVPGTSDEFYFFSGSYDYFWHSCIDARAVTDLVKYLEQLDPHVIFISHFMHIGIDVIDLIRKRMPAVHISVGLHEMLFSCLADGQLIKTTNRQVCSAPGQNECNMCFPSINPDKFAVRHKYFETCLSMADSFISPSQHLACFFVSQFGFASNRSYVVNHPIEIAHYPDTPPDEVTHGVRQLVTFAYFGQFIDNKGIDVLLSAASLLDQKLSSSTLVFKILINGGNRSFATAKYRELIDGLLKGADSWSNGSVVELGSYPHDQVSSRMKLADFVVVPSIWPEVYALVVSEAFACFKPVIASRIGGLAERIDDSNDGFYFEPNNPQDLARIMYLCMQLQFSEYSELAFNARAKAEILTPAKALAQYMQVFSTTSRTPE